MLFMPLRLSTIYLNIFSNNGINEGKNPMEAKQMETRVKELLYQCKIEASTCIPSSQPK